MGNRERTLSEVRNSNLGNRSLISTKHVSVPEHMNFDLANNHFVLRDKLECLVGGLVSEEQGFGQGWKIRSIGRYTLERATKKKEIHVNHQPSLPCLTIVKRV